ncbi:MAG TPA: GspE/PulE family protein [Patescibacteria group bacterium]|nr:GspE/PulE family protein [Patescibacteria group bacterium]
MPKEKEANTKKAKTKIPKKAKAEIDTTSERVEPTAEKVVLEKATDIGDAQTKIAEDQEILKSFTEGKSIQVIEIVNKLLDEAFYLRASDIHIDPTHDDARIRYRIDGIMQDMFRFPKDRYTEIISRIKILSGLRIDEHQAAQDGGFRFEAGGKPIDIRVSIAPTYYGENAVLRLLTNDEGKYELKALGLSELNENRILKAIKRPYGMILATGPTGSGKTTTLYTILKLLNTSEVSIVTLEDPVEYTIAGIEQIQINPQTDLTFANGLKSLLRQDPNIIMVGEIRDKETAGIAVNTALTGHLLLSTIHTNDAATTLPRLLDLNIEPYLIASTVNIAIGQRLVRKLCPSCKVEHKLTDAEVQALQQAMPDAGIKADEIFYAGEGCEACSKTGYKGRLGIYEVLLMDEKVREAVLNRASAANIKEVAVAQGMVPMLYDGVEKARAGITSIEEILRVMYE